MTNAGSIASHGRIYKASLLTIGSFGRLYGLAGEILSLLFYGILSDKKFLSGLTDDERAIVAALLDGNATVTLSDGNVVATLIMDEVKITATLSNNGVVTLVVNTQRRSEQSEDTMLLSAQLSDNTGEFSGE